MKVWTLAIYTSDIIRQVRYFPSTRCAAPWDTLSVLGKRLLALDDELLLWILIKMRV